MKLCAARAEGYQALAAFLPELRRGQEVKKWVPTVLTTHRARGHYWQGGD